MTPNDKRKLREGLSLLQRGDQGLVLTLLQRESFNSIQERYLKDMLAVVEAGPVTELFSIPPGSYGKLLWHFQQARRYVTFPRVYVRLPILGEDVVFSMSGNGSKHPGSIAINNGGAFGKAKNFGRIMTDGSLDTTSATPSGSMDWDTAFAQVLFAMNVNLADFAQRRYLLLGRCIFTDQELEAGPAAVIGYDRITALRWGLPYPAKT